MRKKELKFLQLGLGSMGRRRIRNLFANNERNIIGFDIRSDRNQEAEEKYKIKIVKNFRDLSPQDFNAVIISTSPEAHGDYIRFALKHEKHFFVEHPTNLDGYDEVFKNRDNIVKAPSCTFLHYRPVNMIKHFLDAGRIGKVLAFQYHMGQYLPDWHPWEDYRDVYFSKKETGACREMFAFELIWLNWLMNSAVKEVSGNAAKLTDLDISADDIFLANIKYGNGVYGNLIIDVISRKPFRTLKILGSKGVLEWEKSDSIMKIYNAESKESENISVPKGHPETGYINEEEMYNDEMKAFLDAIAGRREYPHTFQDSRQLLRTMFALEKSGQTGRKTLL